MSEVYYRAKAGKGMKEKPAKTIVFLFIKKNVGYREVIIKRKKVESNFSFNHLRSHIIH